MALIETRSDHGISSNFATRDKHGLGSIRPSRSWFGWAQQQSIIKWECKTQDWAWGVGPEGTSQLFQLVVWISVSSPTTELAFTTLGSQLAHDYGCTGCVLGPADREEKGQPLFTAGLAQHKTASQKEKLLPCSLLGGPWERAVRGSCWRSPWLSALHGNKNSSR